MAQGFDYSAADPDMQVPGWEKISPGNAVVIDRIDSRPPRVLEIADIDGHLMARVVQNFPGNKGEKTAIFSYPSGEQILLTIPDDFNKEETYSFPYAKFKLALSGDGSVTLMSDSTGSGISYQMVDMNLNVDESGCKTVAEGSDDECDGLMIGNRPVAVSTRRRLGKTKYYHRNEDNVGFSRDTVIVADGIGGSYAPEYASKFVVDAFLRDGGDLKAVFNSARHAFQYYFSHYLNVKGLRSDTVFAMARLKKGNNIDLMSVGDARWRLIRAGRVILSSHDDSVVQMMVDAGQITEREKFTNDKRNIVTSSFMCGDPRLFSNVKTHPGDFLVLCSDGMDAITDEEMAEIVSMHLPHDAVKEMNRLVAERNTHIPEGGFLPGYLRDFNDGQPPLPVTSPMDNGTVAVVRL